MHAKLTVGLMFLPRTAILAQLEISCLSIIQKEGRAKKERGIWRCDVYLRYTSPSCDEMLASIRSYCWKKGFASHLSKTRWVFLSHAENSLVSKDVLISRCSVHPTSWVSCQGCSTSESLGTSLSYPESWFFFLKGVCQIVPLYAHVKNFLHVSMSLCWREVAVAWVWESCLRANVCGLASLRASGPSKGCWIQRSCFWLRRLWNLRDYLRGPSLAAGSASVLWPR